MFLRTFGGSLLIAAIGLALGLVYGGGTGLALVAILGILEISLSFDNAVVNATILVRMSPFWQKIFLTVGVAIAVFGMRLIFPLLIVGITAKLNPVEAVRLALEKGDPNTEGTYGYLLNQAHPAIAAFGGMFLLMLFLDFMFEERDITWLTWIEKPLARIGKLDQLSVVIALAALSVSAYTLGKSADTTQPDRISTILVSGALGIATYPLVNGLGEFFDQGDDDDGESDEVEGGEIEYAPTPPKVVQVVGRAAFFLFLYLEVLDASFSFDGVVGAFAITSDPIIIAIGLGVGAMFIRSLTVFLVRQGTLAEYVYLVGDRRACRAAAHHDRVQGARGGHRPDRCRLHRARAGLLDRSQQACGTTAGRQSRHRARRGQRLSPVPSDTSQRGSAMGIDYTKRPATPPPAAPATTPAPAAGSGASVSLSKVTLTKAAPAVSLRKHGGNSGVMLINLNWDVKPPAKGLFRKNTQLDLDLGCLYEFSDGTKGVVQALGNSFRARPRTGSQDLIWLDGDDRSGAVSTGENLFINLDGLALVKRILVFALIYEGAANWADARGVTTITPVGAAPIEILLDDPRDGARICAVALLTNDNGALTVRREVNYLDGAQRKLDETYHWGMNWTAGRK